MYIAIISAMESEIKHFQKIIKITNKEIINNIEFTLGTYNDKKIIICICNEGKVNSAIATQIMISNYDLKFIFNIGVAGGIELNTLDLVLAKNTCQYDYNITALGYKAGEILGINKIYIPCDEKLNNLIKKILGNKIKFGTIATGDTFVNSIEHINYIKKNFKAKAVDMESASIGHVCYHNNVKYICIRAISDTANQIEFKTFLEEAILKLTEAIEKILNDI